MKFTRLVLFLFLFFFCATTLAGISTDGEKNSARSEARKSDGMCSVQNIHGADADNTAHINTQELVAFPGESGCHGRMIGRDFFSKDAYGRDPYFLPTLKKAADLVDSTKQTSLIEHGIRTSVASELLRKRMSALTGIFLADDQPLDKDRYDISFYLPDNNAIVILKIDDDGGNPEWGEMMD